MLLWQLLLKPRKNLTFKGLIIQIRKEKKLLDKCCQELFSREKIGLIFDESVAGNAADFAFVRYELLNISADRAEIVENFFGF